MSCRICGNEDAVEHASLGGGLRFHCQPCGGFFGISFTLESLAEGRLFDVERARERLEEIREQKKRQQQDANHSQNSEPTLTSDDQRLLIDPS